MEDDRAAPPTIEHLWRDAPPNEERRTSLLLVVAVAAALGIAAWHLETPWRAGAELSPRADTRSSEFPACASVPAGCAD